jgi:hypothetical protein
MSQLVPIKPSALPTLVAGAAEAGVRSMQPFLFAATGQGRQPPTYTVVLV